MSLNGLKVEDLGNPYNDLESKKTALLSEISKLGATLEEMDAMVVNHEAKKLQIEDLDKVIKEKKKEIKELDKKKEEKEEKQKEIDALNKSIELLKKEIVRLNNEIPYLDSLVRLANEQKLATIKAEQEIIDEKKKELANLNEKINAATKKKEEVIDSLKNHLDLLQ